MITTQRYEPQFIFTLFVVVFSCLEYIGLICCVSRLYTKCLLSMLVRASGYLEHSQVLP
jgi:hypothetical protein